MLFQGCRSDENIVPRVSFYHNNGLLPNIVFTTNNESDVLIEYWPYTDSTRVCASQISKGVDHNFILVNLKPLTDYSFVIKNLTTGSRSNTYSFQTLELPKDVIDTKKVLIDTALFNGYILVRSVGPVGSEAIINNEGDVVWYHRYDTAVRRPFFWTNNKSILSIYDSSQIFEHDLFGDQKLNLKLDQHKVLNMLHHEILFNEKEQILSLTHDSTKMDLRKLGGTKDQYLRADGIILLSKEGEKLWDWNLLAEYNPLEAPIGKIDLKQSLGHANSMTIDKDGHYLVSFRDFSQIWKIHSENGSVIWKLGKGGDFTLDEDDYFIAQHSLCFNSDGDLMFFDNGDRSARPYSRVLSFKIEEDKRKVTNNLKINLPLELSAYKMCSADYIDRGKYLICTSKKNGIISVVDDTGNVLWRVDLNRPSYRAYYLPNPFEKI